MNLISKYIRSDLSRTNTNRNNTNEASTPQKRKTI